MGGSLSRRDLLAAGGAIALTRGAAAADSKPGFVVCAFSKHFQWAEAPELAETASSLGYDAIDLTLRPNGHVLPERVDEDLPKTVEILRKKGLAVPMVTSHIVDAATPHAERVVKTLAAAGIRRYRWGGFRYDAKAPLRDQLAAFKPRIRDLAALNKQYGVCAMYHTHSGIGQVGASMWDLHFLLEEFDPEAVSVNYDIGHATVEGGLGGWIHSTRLMLPRMRGVAVKDFMWTRNEKGAWVPGWRPLGQGMVNFRQFFSMLKEGGFAGPLQHHMEYDELGGADAGRKQFTIPKEKLLEIMRRDLDALKALLRESGLAGAASTGAG